MHFKMKLNSIRLEGISLLWGKTELGLKITHIQIIDAWVRQTSIISVPTQFIQESAKYPIFMGT